MRDNFQKQFGENFKRLRKSKNMSQDAVAEGSETSPSYISAIETGKANPTLSTVEALAKGLGVDVSELFLFLASQATPEQIRDRLKGIVDAADNRGLRAIYDAVLSVFRP